MSGGETGETAESPWVEDSLLGERVRLLQPREGYRAAIDPVLLAAATRAEPGERVLDVGTGAGTAALCLAARVPGVRVSGLEQDSAMAEVARHNVALNGMQGRIWVMAGDLLRPPPMLAPASFDRVMANPPYLKAGAATPSADSYKARANVEGEAGLRHWIAFAASMLKSRGWFTLVHRADRVDEILHLLHGKFGAVSLFPLWPHQGEPARRVLIAAQRGAKAPARLLPGLVLHDAAGRFTPEAEAVLRDGVALEL